MATRRADHLRRWWGRLITRRPSARRFDQVTDADIYSCYRLLLGREPDAEGLRCWNDLAGRGLIDLHALAQSFLASAEYREREEAMHRPHLVELGEFKMFVRLNDYLIGAAIARDKLYEPHVAAEVRRRLRAGAVFVDVGANVGYFTLLAAALVGSEGRVVAFEPNPDNQALLARSIGVNAFTNIDLRPYAVAERAQSCVLEVAAICSNGTLVDDAPASSGANRVRVEAVAIDDVLGALARVDLVKMDIEGAEPRAVRGMQRLIRTHRPVIITEFSPQLIERVSRVRPTSFLAQLRACGYELCVVGPIHPRRSGPQSDAEILALHARSGMTHLDLLATPAAGVASA